MGVPVKDVVRWKQKDEIAAAGISEASSDDALLDAMAAHAHPDEPAHRGDGQGRETVPAGGNSGGLVVNAEVDPQDHRCTNRTRRCVSWGFGNKNPSTKFLKLYFDGL